MSYSFKAAYAVRTDAINNPAQTQIIILNGASGLLLLNVYNM